jgi:predicted phosphoribosyltransferase
VIWADISPSPRPSPAGRGCPPNEAELQSVIAAEREELERRNRLYRYDRPPPEVKAKTVILVDDGLATGASMRAAAATDRVYGM